LYQEIKGILTAPMLAQAHESLQGANWIDGASSAGAHARQVKRNEELDQSSPAWRDINELVVPALLQNREFQSATLPARVSAAYVVRYSGDMSYGSHVDDPVMGGDGARYRADVAVTVFLNSPDSYQGGELRIHRRNESVAVKLDAGSAVAYPAGSVHEVTPVTDGERIVCVLWAQSLVRSAEQREVLADLDDARLALRQATPQAQVTSSVDRAYTNLMRLWAEP